jgi:hypothetical protein
MRGGTRSGNPANEKKPPKLAWTTSPMAKRAERLLLDIPQSKRRANWQIANRPLPDLFVFA